MKCSKCNTENESGARYCCSCGEPLNASSPNSFPAEISFLANFKTKFNSIGGKLFLTPTQIIFRAHKLNFGDLDEKVYEIKDYVGFHKGLLTNLDLSFSNGETIKLVVWNKNALINEITARKEALENIGKESGGIGSFKGFE